MAGRSTTLPQRLYLTRRGLALAVALVAFLFVSMAVTLAVSWVAVSDSPLGRPGTFATSDGVLARG